ncbi:homoserine kinase [Bacillus shivajii]|uniref:homoserine kinase n=1 Tax=Bacillus shivajii TaxID=1983719 RepID=UPI001CFC0672|nr:homoserine kinase [Bacillus shivajii]UCZ54664.1 homoserine kinase [Bacillus shivajii]
MKNKYLFSVTVPGSTANLGPGFDSVGLAINRYLKLNVYESDKWRFVPLSENLDDIPQGKTNFIYKIASSVAEQFYRLLPACEVEVNSELPLARGLGSSAAAIVAGIELADQLLDLQMHPKEKVHLASQFEGHPDNVAASYYGGLVIGTHHHKETDVIFGIYPEFDIVAVIPEYELKTSSARDLLPSELSYCNAVKASSISNVLIAALLQERWDIAGKMMQNDLFHHPYRDKVIPEFNEVVSLSSNFNMYGIALSGAGPSIMCFVPQGIGSELQQELAAIFKSHSIQLLNVEKRGVVVELNSSLLTKT